MKNNNRNLYFVFFISMLLFSCSQTQEKQNSKYSAVLTKAQQSFQQESYYEAIKQYESIANESSLAAIRLGEIYSSNILGQPDHKKAFYWVELAAKKDNALANYYLALYYLSGKVTHVNPFLAHQLLVKSFKQNHYQSAYQIALLYYTGVGVEKNLYKARQWSKLGADKGVRDAMVLLGKMIYSGDGGEQDKEKGSQWLHKARTK